MPEDSGICISTNSGSRNILFRFQNTESSQDQAVCVYGGHLQKCEKSLTLRGPSAGASERLDFPYFCSRPPYTHTAWSWLLSSVFNQLIYLIHVHILNAECPRLRVTAEEHIHMTVCGSSVFYCVDLSIDHQLCSKRHSTHSNGSARRRSCSAGCTAACP